MGGMGGMGGMVVYSRHAWKKENDHAFKTCLALPDGAVRGTSSRGRYGKEITIFNEYIQGRAKIVCFLESVITCNI